jgi:hypothetical protein
MFFFCLFGLIPFFFSDGRDLTFTVLQQQPWHRSFSPYPTCGELEIALTSDTLISPDLMRLRWFFEADDPPSAITILQDITNAVSAQEPHPSNHLIVSLPLTYSLTEVSTGISTATSQNPRNWTLCIKSTPSPKVHARTPANASTLKIWSSAAAAGDFWRMGMRSMSSL